MRCIFFPGFKANQDFQRCLVTQAEAIVSHFGEGVNLTVPESGLVSYGAAVNVTVPFCSLQKELDNVSIEYKSIQKNTQIGMWKVGNTFQVLQTNTKPR